MEGMASSPKNPKWLLPGSIFVSALILAVALIYSVGARNLPQRADVRDAIQPVEQQTGNSNIVFRPVGSGDHIRGNPDAPVKVIEYSDLECPFCQRFHETMLQVLEQYDGQVAWVYRHFPLTQIHPKAVTEAEATECAAALGGNNAFWAMVDAIFEITPANNRLDLALLPQIAERIGLNRNSFEQCLNNRTHAGTVEAQLQDAIGAGGRGTPYSIVVAANGQTFPITGALPLSSVAAVIEQALQASR